ncbi:hypothetical protein [Nonomuraea antri]|nr:hypothetical protein [Nonomuraea antri]
MRRSAVLIAAAVLVAGCGGTPEQAQGPSGGPAKVTLEWWHL